MGTRSRYVAATAATVGVAMAARRRARLRRAMAGFRDSVLPTHVDEGPETAVGVDEIRAAGHQHVVHDAEHPTRARRLRSRPWTKHAHGMTHPFAGE